MDVCSSVMWFVGPPGGGERTVELMPPSRALITSSPALSHSFSFGFKSKIEFRLVFLFTSLTHPKPHSFKLKRNLVADYG